MTLPQMLDEAMTEITARDLPMASPPLQEDVPRKSPRLNPVSGKSGGGSNVGDGGDNLDEGMTLTLTLSLRLTLNAD